MQTVTMRYPDPGRSRASRIERAVAAAVRHVPPAVLVAGCVALSLAVGELDYALAAWSGFDFAVTPLYLVPVGLAALGAGTVPGLAVAVAAAVVEGASTRIANSGGRATWSVVVVSVALELLVFVGAAVVVGALRRHVDEERRLSRTDPLTGVGNSRGLREEAAVEIARARRGTPLSLAYLDVDDVKRVNDAFGHQRGDELLAAVGRTLREAVRLTDYVARVGGDEFAVLLAGADGAVCRAVAGRVRDRLRAAVEALGLGNTVSIGVTTFHSPPDDVDALLRDADAAMYAVKRRLKDDVLYLERETPGTAPHYLRRSGSAPP